VSSATKVAGTGLDFQLRLPPDWMVLETAGERIPSQLTRLLDRAVERDPGVAAHRGMIEKQLRSVLRTVRSQDLSFCAMLATVVADVLPMYATLTGALRSSAGGNDLTAIATEVQRKPGVSVSRCAAGQLTALRACYRSTVNDESAGRPIEAAVWQYFVPSPEGNRVAVLTGATPVLPLEVQFGELFDAVIETFEFIAADGTRSTAAHSTGGTTS
jgi:hypothetical protein